MGNVRDRNISVVLADDHTVVRESLTFLLQDCGLQVVGEAANGQEAVWLCQRLHPEIVVLDISMPLLNGFEAAREIAAVSPATKIVFLTGHSAAEYAEEALRVGGRAFVSKKHVADCLIAAIKAVLDGKTYVSRESAA